LIAVEDLKKLDPALIHAYKQNQILIENKYYRITGPAAATACRNAFRPG